MANKYLDLIGLGNYTAKTYGVFPTDVNYVNTYSSGRTYESAPAGWPTGYYTKSGDTYTAATGEFSAETTYYTVTGKKLTYNTYASASYNSSTGRVDKGTATAHDLFNTEGLKTDLGLGTAAYADLTSTYAASDTTKAATGAAIAEAIQGIANAMVFKGTVGAQEDSPTITALPVDGTANIGDTYKVITAGTYAGETAKVGDVFTCNGKTANANTWVLIPSGDEPSGTVTSIGVTGDGLHTVIGGIEGTTAISESGSIKLIPATASTIGGVSVPATGGLGVDANGAISANIDGITIKKNASDALTNPNALYVPTATSSALGVVAVGSNITNTNGVISVADGSDSVKGVVQVDNTTIKVTDGTITATTAVAGTAGIATVAADAAGGLNIADGVISVNTITYDGASSDIGKLFTTGA